MGELAAHLVDGVLSGLPVRQWVLTLPFRLRYRLAYDHRLCRAVLGVFVRALLGFEQRRARVLGVRGRAGSVTAIQRCGSALNANPHFHTLVAEGVFAEHPDGSYHFVPLREPPSDVEVARLLAAVRGRIIRLLPGAHRGFSVQVDNDRAAVAAAYVRPGCPSICRSPRQRARPSGSRACALPIMSTTPAAAGPTDRTTAATPIRAARQHWRCRAIARGRPAKLARCLFRALDWAARPRLSMLPWGQGHKRPAGNGPRGGG